MLFTFSYLALVCNTFGVRNEGFLSVESSKTVLFTYRAPCIWPYSLFLSSSVGALSGHNHGYVATCGHWGFISFKGSVLGSLCLQNPDIFIAGPINFVDPEVLYHNCNSLKSFGIKLRNIMSHVGWHNRSSAAYYMQLSKVMSASSLSSVLPGQTNDWGSGDFYGQCNSLRHFTPAFTR